MKKGKTIVKKLILVIVAVAACVALCVSAYSANSVTKSSVNMGGANANVLYVDMSASNRALVPVVANGSMSTDAPAGNVLSTVKSGKVVAAINGGFFNSYYNASAGINFSNGNYPRVFNTVISEGRVVANGGNIPAIGMDYSGNIYIDIVKISPIVTLRGSAKISAWGVNTVYNDSAAVYVLTDMFDYAVDIPQSSKIVTIQNNTVKSVVNGYNGYRVPNGAVAMVYGATAYANATKWDAQPVVGESAVFSYTATTSDGANSAAWNNMRTVMGAGGILVKNGVSAVDNAINPTAADQKPDVVGQRSFVAKLNDGRIVMGTVTASFRTIANSLISLGARDAVFMDGGASSALYCDGSFVTSPGRKLATMLAVVDENSSAVKPDTSVPENANGPSSWAKASVDSARSLGILPSHLDNNYKRNITRKEFCDLIAGFIRVKTGISVEYTCVQKEITVHKNRFSDSNDYYVPYIASLGIINGYGDGTFRPKDAIKRQDAAIMLQRLAQFLEAESRYSSKTFTDAAQISAYAKPGVDFVTSLGIMNGNANGTFSPMSNITREQAIITIMNAYNNIK